MCRPLTAAACGLALLAGLAAAEEKMPIELKLVLKKETYDWPYGQAPKEFEAALQDVQKKHNAGQPAQFPSPPALDVALQITNTGTESATVYTEGDANLLTLTLKGPGVVTVEPGLAVTTELREPKATVLGPGKSIEIPVKNLADGFRRVGRYLYPTAPGEYSLSATYQLAGREGAKGPLLRSGEVRFKIEDKK
jgi:hypothetical protein